MITFADSIPPEAPSPEARIETVTGPLWPVCRPDMVDPDAIAMRMSEDVLALFDRAETVSEDDVVRLGWPRASVRRYGDRAREGFIRLLTARTRARHLPTARAA